MKNVPTAEEFATEYDNMRMPRGVSYQYEIGEMMIEFAKLHVEAALKAASKNATLKDEGRYVLGDEDWHEDLVINKESILNAYQLTNIK